MLLQRLIFAPGNGEVDNHTILNPGAGGAPAVFRGIQQKG